MKDYKSKFKKSALQTLICHADLFTLEGILEICMDGDDDLEDHSNALDEVNMKHTIGADDTAHSVYQVDFIENTTIAESAESENKGHFVTYDEWNYADRHYKEDFCKVYPKTQLKTDRAFYKKILNDNRSTLMGLRKMLTTVNNKYQ